MDGQFVILIVKTLHVIKKMNAKFFQALKLNFNLSKILQLSASNTNALHHSGNDIFGSIMKILQFAKALMLDTDDIEEWLEVCFYQFRVSQRMLSEPIHKSDVRWLTRGKALTRLNFTSDFYR